MENLQNFTDIFDLKELGDTAPDRDTKVQIATVQSFVKRILYSADDTPPPTADRFDCIVVDECHRGYLLDRELSDRELTFRDEFDYISKYRRVLDHFDAVKIGLTATPALHTTQIFGEPIYTYSYREAVIDGWLIDHEPPFQIRTRLSQEGIVWKGGEAMEFFAPKTGQLDLVHAPDEVKFEVEQFNKRVITEEFNRVVCEVLVQNIDPSLREKTLIFCATDHHADVVVDRLKIALADQYGSVEDDAVVKITGNADRPLQLIRQFRNEVNPKIAVTVDLLTTGIDIPAICNLVFIRRVNSRILYEQMLGRATRRCDEIGKQVFRIFDAVNLYEALAPVSTMKPVAVNPNISFTQLVDELATVEDAGALAEIVDQLLAKLQRQRRQLSNDRTEAIEALAAMPLQEIVDYLRQTEPVQIKEWFRDRATIAQILDMRDGGRQPLLISRHADELLGVERGYGNAQKPEDYLDSFKAFLRDNLNQIPALVVVTQRPRDLTRAQLKELRLLLDAAGYSETTLQAAWQDMTNEDIAASIIGFIRQAALGDALVSYEQRVDRAIAKILALRAWTPPQRKWLERIAKQLKVETIVDKEALDRGEFKTQGGFTRINKVFEGQLEAILAEINDRLWQDVSYNRNNESYRPKFVKTAYIMFENFSRRNHLDKPIYELKYEYVPPAFRMDIYKVVRAKCENAIEEYCLFRDSAVSVNKSVVRFYSTEDIEEQYNPDFFLQFLLNLEWHEMLSVAEYFLTRNNWYVDDTKCFLTAQEANHLLEYYQLGYRVEEGLYRRDLKVSVYYEELIADNIELLSEDISYQAVIESVKAAKEYLIDRKNINIGNSIKSSFQALEGYLRGYFGKCGRMPSTLGECVKQLDQQKLCPPNIIESLKQIYIYSNRTENIRHGTPNLGKLSVEDALLCNAMAISFINYFHRKLP